MKKFTILLAVLMLSCSTDEVTNDDCRCTKTTYTYETVVDIGSDGLPNVTQIRRDLSTEAVPCQEEQPQVSLQNGNYFEILCD